MQYRPITPKAWAIVPALLAVLVSVSLVLAYDQATSPVLGEVAPAPQEETGPYAPGEVLVKFKEGVSKEVVPVLASTLGYKVQDEISAIGVYVLAVPAGQEWEAVKTLTGSEAVEFAEPNYLIFADGPESKIEVLGDVSKSLTELEGTPNDPYYAGYQWNLNNTGQQVWTGSQWVQAKPGADIKAPGAWDVHTGSQVILGMIGSGIEMTHPDLAGKLVPGYDFVNHDENANDDNGRGTFQAGIAAAQTNNGVGVAGVSWGARMMPLKVIASNGSGTWADVAAAITYAADHGVRVIHVGEAGQSLSYAARDAVSYAYELGALIVAPAHLPYPASFDYVLGVASTDYFDDHPSWTGTGPHVDLSAPGAALVSSYTNGSIVRWTPGMTPGASSHVAGLASLILSMQPELSANQVVEILTGSADDLGSPGWDAQFGYGRINAAQAVGQAVQPASTATTAPPEPTETPEEPEPTATPCTGTILNGCIGFNGKVTGRVWHDINGNRRRETWEHYLAGAVLTLRRLDGTVVGMVTTTYDGGYYFGGLDSSQYYILTETNPPGYPISTTPDVWTIQPSDFAHCCTATVHFGDKEGPPTGTFTPTPTATATATATLTPVPTGLLADTPTPIPTATFTPTPTATPTLTPSPTVPSPIQPGPGQRIQLPAIDNVGGAETWLQVQNVGGAPAKAILFLWASYSGFCEPQNPGPFKVECSGLIRPGSAWTWRSAQLPSSAMGGIVYSVPADLADLACSAAQTMGWSQWEQNWWNEVWGVGSPLVVSVNRSLPVIDGFFMASAYTGISENMEGMYDPQFGGYMYYAPLNYNDYQGCTSTLIIQNSGTQCTSVEIWYKEQDNCLRAVIDDVLALAPGESVRVTPPRVPAGSQGSAWIRASQPLGVVVDLVCEDMLLTHRGVPADSYGAGYSAGSLKNYGSIIYREFNGWDTLIQVQNLSSTVNAKVKAYFVDNGGDVIKTVVDWICPRGSQTFFLPAINDLPGLYVGSVRMESQDWWSPGDPPVDAPRVLGVVNLINAQTGQGVSYNAFTQGAQALSIPLMLKQKMDASGVMWSTQLAIQNINMNPGSTTFRIDIYDQNGWVTSYCQTLNEKQVEYISLDDLGLLVTGFTGSAVIEAECSDQEGGPQLVAIAVEQGVAEGDLTKAYEGFPMDPALYQPPAVPPCAECGEVLPSATATVVPQEMCTAPVDVMLVLDRSGSMAGQKLADAKNASIAFLDLLDFNKDWAGLASFASYASLDQGLTADKASVVAAINALNASGTTDIGDGVLIARDELVNNGRADTVQAMIVLSNGEANQGPDPIAAADSAKAAGIKMITIGLGPSAASRATLQAMASSLDLYYEAPTSSDLLDIFEEIAEEVPCP